MDEALRKIEGFVDEGGPHLVATVNPEFVMRARADKSFARVLESADLCLADGSGVVWDVRPQAWARRACAIAGRPLTAQEWRDALPELPYSPGPHPVR